MGQYSTTTTKLLFLDAITGRKTTSWAATIQPLTSSVETSLYVGATTHPSATPSGGNQAVNIYLAYSTTIVDGILSLVAPASGTPTGWAGAITASRITYLGAGDIGSGDDFVLLNSNTSVVGTPVQIQQLDLWFPPDNGATMRFNMDIRNKLAAALLYAGGSANCPAMGSSSSSKFEFYDGVQPVDGGGSVGSSTLLGTITGSQTWSTVSFVSFTATTTLNPSGLGGTAVANGTATWVRWTNGAGDCVIDFSVGTSGTDMILASTSFVNGSAIPAISSFALVWV